MLSRWTALTRLYDNGRIALDNNPAERALRSVTGKNHLFVGSDRGAEPAAIFYTLIETAKLNGSTPRPICTNVLARIADHPPDASRTCCRVTGCRTRRSLRLPDRQGRSPSAYGVRRVGDEPEA